MNALSTSNLSFSDWLILLQADARFADRCDPAKKIQRGLQRLSDQVLAHIFLEGIGPTVLAIREWCVNPERLYDSVYWAAEQKRLNAGLPVAYDMDDEVGTWTATLRQPITLRNGPQRAA